MLVYQRVVDIWGTRKFELARSHGHQNLHVFQHPNSGAGPTPWLGGFKPWNTYQIRGVPWQFHGNSMGKFHVFHGKCREKTEKPMNFMGIHDGIFQKLDDIPSV
jgi:hypothetical protein